FRTIHDVRSAPAGERVGLHQADLILDRLQPPDGAAEARAVSPREPRFARGAARTEPHRIDAVLYLTDPPGRHTDDFDEVTLEIARHGHVARHPRPKESAQAQVLRISAVEIIGVTAMFAMHAYRNARAPGRNQRVQAGKIAAVHDRRPV